MGMVSSQEDIQKKQDDTDHMRAYVPVISGALKLVFPPPPLRSPRPLPSQKLTATRPRSSTPLPSTRKAKSKQRAKQSTAPLRKKNEPLQLDRIPSHLLLPVLRRAWGISRQRDGWVLMGDLGQSLQLISPGFYAPNYGHKNLSRLIRAYANAFDIKEDSKMGFAVRLRH